MVWGEGVNESVSDHRHLKAVRCQRCERKRVCGGVSQVKGHQRNQRPSSPLCAFALHNTRQPANIHITPNRARSIVRVPYADIVEIANRFVRSGIARYRYATTMPRRISMRRHKFTCGASLVNTPTALWVLYGMVFWSGSCVRGEKQIYTYIYKYFPIQHSIVPLAFRHRVCVPACV